ncbi:erythromycin esterase [Aureococcus anophagefferens]|nr:erythromycin esterase [Aureococcus anophagefferens]
MTIKLSIDDLEPDRPPGTIGAPPGLFGGNRSAAPPAGGFQEELRRGTAMGLPPGFAPPLDDAALGRPFVVTGKSGVVVRGDASLDSSAVGEVKFGVPRADAAGRASGGRARAARAESAGGSPSARVVVAGGSRGDLGGAEGVVVLWNAGERRWGVALDDGSPVASFDDGDLDHAARRAARRTTPWLWRNKEVLAFVEWMRAHNEAAASTGAPLCGFVGLDLFCLDRSARAVVDYLDSVDPHVADTAKHALAPFLFSSPDEYSVACASEARSDARGAADHADALRAACEALLSQLQANRYDYWDAGVDAADHFAAEQHAEVVVSAQQFYSKRLTEPDVTWSVRDQHMANALLRLRNQLEMIHGAPPRIVVFAHNSHVGDGRQTATGSQWNVGYLARETFGAAVRILGFSTFQGAVTAMPDGSRTPKRMTLAPALPGSCERVLRDNFRYYPGPNSGVGVHYLRDDERTRHYIDSNMAEQYDAVVYVDTTAALEPIDDVADWANGD